MLSKLLGDRVFIRSMFRLAVPIALQNLLITSFSVVDTVMVSTLGEASLAAVGFTMTWGMFLNFLIFGLASGASVFIAQYWGVKDIKNIRRAYGIALISAIVVSVVFSLLSFLFPRLILRMFTPDQMVIDAGSQYIRIVAFSYIITGIGMIISTVLRSTELVKLPLVASMIGVAANVLLNYILIFGNFGAPRMGIRGAAIASLISVVVNLGVLIGVSFIKKNIAISSIKTLMGFDSAFARSFFVLCLPVFINELIWGVGKMIFNIVYGHMGTDAYAALTAYRTIENVMLTLFVGISNAAGIMIGKKVGAGRPDEAYQEARHFAIWVPVLSVILSILFIMLRHPIMGFFSLKDTAMSIGLSLMLVAAAEQPFRYFDHLFIVGVFRAGGDTKISLKIDLIGQWCTGILLALLGGIILKLPFLLVYAVAASSESVIKAVICARHFISKKWIKAITEEGKRVNLAKA